MAKNFKVHLVVVLLMTPGLVWMMEKGQKDLSLLDTINDIPKYCRILAEAVNAQPLFDGREAKTGKRKLLPWKDENDCMVCALMSNFSRKFLKYPWPIHMFESDRYFSLVGDKDLGGGLELSLYELEIQKQSETCSLEQLEDAYKQVIEELQSDWEPTILSENQKGFLANPEKEWFLFIKKNANDYAKKTFKDNLINFLAKKFGLYKMITCHPLEVNQNGCYALSTTIFLEIKKDAFEKFQKVFKLKIKGFEKAQV